MGLRPIPLLVLLVTIALLPGVVQAQSGQLDLVLTRIDDSGSSGDTFAYDVYITLQMMGKPTNVQLQIDGGSVIELDGNASNDEWSTFQSFATLDALRTAVDGVWALTLVRIPGDITSTFIVSASSLVDGDFFPAATITQPRNGDTGVAPDVNLTWSDPTGASTPDVLVVEIENETYSDGSANQEDDSVQGSLQVTDTSWDPPADLSPGAQEPMVSYYVADESRVTMIVVDPIGLSWTLSPWAPAGYPAGKPLLGLGSEAEIAFGVSVEEDFEAYTIQSDTTGSSVPDGHGGFVTAYSILGAGGARVASVSDSLASEANVVADISISQAWEAVSAAGATGSIDGEDGFLMIGDLPSLSDALTTGPFSDFFGTDPSSRESKDMDRSFVRLWAREATSNASSEFRLLMTDDAGNQIATDRTALTSANTHYSFAESAFSNLVASSTFDKSSVEGIGVEFFTTPGTAPTLNFRVDNVAIDFVPEPASGVLGLAALLTLGAIRRASKR